MDDLTTEARGLRAQDIVSGQMTVTAVSILVGALLVYFTAIGKWPFDSDDAAWRMALFLFFAMNVQVQGCCRDFFLRFATQTNGTNRNGASDS